MTCSRETQPLGHAIKADTVHHAARSTHVLSGERWLQTREASTGKPSWAVTYEIITPWVSPRCHERD